MTAPRKTLIVAFSLCIVCSVIVSAAAVMLKPVQEVNKTLDRKRNILAAAGMLEDDKSVEEQFAQVSTRVVDLRSGQIRRRRRSGEVRPAQGRQGPLAIGSTGCRAGSGQDLASRELRHWFISLRTLQGDIEKIILPIRGYGLWSTLYGFIALEADANTVAGLGFYEHGETPGPGRRGR